VINEFYLENLETVKRTFQEEGQVVLFDFFTKDFFSLLKKIAEKKPRPEKDPLLHSFSTVSVDLPELPFLRSLFKKQPDFRSYRFGWKDYTLLHDLDMQKPGIDIIIDLAEDWQEKWGGSVYYVDGTGNFTKMPIKANTLILVKRTSGNNRFIKYVNHLAGTRKRSLLIGSL